MSRSMESIAYPTLVLLSQTEFVGIIFAWSWVQIMKNVPHIMLDVRDFGKSCTYI